MNLEETIQTIFDGYPLLFKEREPVLVYLYCMFGTGYEWRNGELINIQGNKNIFKGQLGQDGQARQKKNMKNVALRIIYDQYKNDISISYKEFKEKYKEDTCFETIVIKHTLERIAAIQGTFMNDINKKMSKEYSPIYNIPDDITDDWRNGLEEVKTILKKYDIVI